MTQRQERRARFFIFKTEMILNMDEMVIILNDENIGRKFREARTRPRKIGRNYSASHGRRT